MKVFLRLGAVAIEGGSKVLQMGCMNGCGDKPPYGKVRLAIDLPRQWR